MLLPAGARFSDSVPGLAKSLIFVAVSRQPTGLLHVPAGHGQLSDLGRVHHKRLRFNVDVVHDDPGVARDPVPRPAEGNRSSAAKRLDLISNELGSRVPVGDDVHAAGVSWRPGDGVIKTANPMPPFLRPNVRWPTYAQRCCKLHLLFSLRADDKQSEQVTVPAGTFDAFKIVGLGRWSKLNGRASSASQLTVWDAPQVKRFVRYDDFRAAYGKGSPHGYSDQLTSYRLQR
jgi:hypothetical protein